MTLKEIVEQLRMCRYQCEAGPLENNVAFVELERLAEDEDPWPKIRDAYLNRGKSEEKP